MESKNTKEGYIKIDLFLIEDSDSDSVVFVGETKKSPKKPEYKASLSPKDILPIVHPSLEYLDPNPDIHHLFVRFSHEFFYDQLKTVEVKWSKRMTKYKILTAVARDYVNTLLGRDIV